MHVVFASRFFALFACVSLSGCASVGVDELLSKPPVYEQKSNKLPRDLALCLSSGELAKRSYITMMAVKNGYGFSIYEGADASSVIVFTNDSAGSLIKVHAKRLSSYVTRVLDGVRLCEL